MKVFACVVLASIALSACSPVSNQIIPTREDMEYCRSKVATESPDAKPTEAIGSYNACLDAHTEQTGP
ncbi:MAG: hypothetical protein ABA06_01555 [Parcubacteria bacterium C7867-001]|nr:MAG: hypothetical protein ABA06_01555 [Parcubacteria bacterium C7867-001]